MLANLKFTLHTNNKTFTTALSFINKSDLNLSSTGYFYGETHQNPMSGQRLICLNVNSVKETVDHFRSSLVVKPAPCSALPLVQTVWTCDSEIQLLVGGVYV